MTNLVCNSILALVVICIDQKGLSLSFSLSDGKGVFTYKNGDVYNGPWLDGMKHGKGELRAVRGDSYCGEWARDQPHGLGEMSYASGLLYNGNWENGQVGTFSSPLFSIFLF